MFIQDDESDANLSSDGHDDQSWMPDNPENEFMQLQNMQYTVDDNEDYFDNLPLSISQRIEVHREDDNFAFNAVPDFDEPTLNQSPLLSPLTNFSPLPSLNSLPTLSISLSPLPVPRIYIRAAKAGKMLMPLFPAQASVVKAPVGPPAV